MEKQQESINRNAALPGGIPNTYCRDDRSESNMKNNGYSTDTASQRKRILDWLQSSPLTTLQARKELDVMHPAARVQELRARGYNIVLNWVVEYTGKAKHRIGQYVLFAGGANGQ